MLTSTWTEPTFWVAAVACAVAQLAIVRSVFVARAPVGAADGAPDSAAGRVPATRRAAEVTWAVLPALALAGVLVLTWRAMHAAPAFWPAS